MKAESEGMIARACGFRRRMGFAGTIAAAVLTALGSQAQAAESGASQPPILRVPRFAQAPVIDGKVDAAEWADAAAITGFGTGGPSSTDSLVPEVQQVVWRIGYDDKYLYLAMRSPLPPGTSPNAKVKEPDSDDIVFEDHVEIQVCPHDRSLAKTPGNGFFKVMINPKNTVTDHHWFNGTPATEVFWSMGGATKSRVTADAWELEVAIELERMGVKSLDNRPLIIQLVRTDSCTGIYFAGWVGAAWQSWDRFAEVNFDPQAPVFQFTRLGEIMAGTLDAEVALAGRSGKPREIEVTLAVEDAAGKSLYRQKQTATVKRGETKTLQWKAAGLPVQAMPVADKARNHFEITATYKDESGTRVLYRNRSPFMALDASFREKYLDPWVRLRPQGGEWEALLAYLPYAGKAEVSVDLDFFGLPEAVTSAASYAVEVAARGQKKPLGRAEGTIRALAGERMLVDLPDLPDGDYEAVFTLRDAKGAGVAQKRVPFVRKRYPWEHNTIGISDEVIPPYLPMRVNDNTLKVWKHDYRGIPKETNNVIQVWGRAFAVGPGGLINQVHVAAPTGTAGEPLPLLAAPMRLEAVVGGKPAAAANASVRFVAAAPHRVDIEGEQTLGPLAVTTKAFVEYDGWYQVALEVSRGKVQASGQKPGLSPEPRTPNPEPSQQIDSVDLLIDLADIPVDTIYAQRAHGARYGNCLKALSRQAGIQFRSTDLIKAATRNRTVSKDWLSFLPNLFVGNGDRGLYFHAWSDEGWALKDGEPAVTVERLKDGTARARVRFLAGPVVLDAPRRIEFAFQVLPVKPNLARYRTLRGEGQIFHDTPGWRYYGDSTDGYALHSDADYEALRKYLLYGFDEQAHPDWKNAYWPHDRQLRYMPIHNGSKIVMYGSTMIIGTGMEEFGTFGGEWCGDSNWKPKRQGATNKGWWNMGGTIQWTNDCQLSIMGVNWTQSVTDNYLWYYRPLIQKCGFNGTWWDDANLWPIQEYDEQAGRMAIRWNQLQRRQLCKRLNILGWQSMRPPMWIQHAHTDFSWCQFFWMVEGDYYADNKDMTALQQMTMDEWRAMTRTRSTMLAAIPWLKHYEGTTPELDRKIRRSVVGVGLSLDFHQLGREYPASAEAERLLRFAVDLADTENCLFMGYWNTGKVIQPAGRDVYATVYQNAACKSAVVVLFNGRKGMDQVLGGTTFDPTALIGLRQTARVKRVYDLETGAPVAFSVANGVYTITDPLFVPWHDYRLLAVEAE